MSTIECNIQHTDKCHFQMRQEWIKANADYNLQTTEVYRRLWMENLINTELHTKEQVYYWTSVYKKDTYIMNRENQLLQRKRTLSSESFLKVLVHIENNFVRALDLLAVVSNYWC